MRVTTVELSLRPIASDIRIASFEPIRCRVLAWRHWYMIPR